MNNKNNIPSIIGATLISFAAFLWALEGITLIPKFYHLPTSFVVFSSHGITTLAFLIPALIYLFKDGAKNYNRIKTLGKSSYFYMFLVALFGGALGTLAIVKAISLVHYEPLSAVILLQKLQPIFAIILARVLLKEKVTSSFYVWAIPALIGTYFLTFGFALPVRASGDNLLLSYGLGLFAAFAFGSSTVFGKKILDKLNFFETFYLRYFMVSLIMIVFIFITNKDNFSPETLVLQVDLPFLIIMALGTGAFGIILYYLGLKSVKASTATLCELAFPISTIALDFFVNKKTLSVVQLISAAVIIFCVTQVVKASQKN